MQHFRFLSFIALFDSADARIGEHVANTASASNHPAGPCERQAVFDIMMCNSHMCNDCVMEFCTEKCQWVQSEFAGCVCQSWPAARSSFSGGEFAGKGRFGDESDYAHAGFRARNTYGDDHTAQGFRDGSDAHDGMSAYDWTPEGIYAAANGIPQEDVVLPVTTTTTTTTGPTTTPDAPPVRNGMMWSDLNPDEDDYYYYYYDTFGDARRLNFLGDKKQDETGKHMGKHMGKGMGHMGHGMGHRHAHGKHH